MYFIIFVGMEKFDFFLCVEYILLKKIDLPIQCIKCILHTFGQIKKLGIFVHSGIQLLFLEQITLLCTV